MGRGVWGAEPPRLEVRKLGLVVSLRVSQTFVRETTVFFFHWPAEYPEGGVAEVLAVPKGRSPARAGILVKKGSF